jgi:hypothetical protein
VSSGADVLPRRTQRTLRRYDQKRMRINSPPRRQGRQEQKFPGNRVCYSEVRFEVCLPQKDSFGAALNRANGLEAINTYSEPTRTRRAITCGDFVVAQNVIRCTLSLRTAHCVLRTAHSVPRRYNPIRLHHQHHRFFRRAWAMHHTFRNGNALSRI